MCFDISRIRFGCFCKFILSFFSVFLFINIMASNIALASSGSGSSSSSSSSSSVNNNNNNNKNNNILNFDSSILEINQSQIVLLKSIKSVLDNMQNNTQDRWNKYVNMESDILYPKLPFPAWQVFVSQNSSSDDFLNSDSKRMKSFVNNLTNNKYLKYVLSASNKSDITGDMSFPLNLNLNKSISTASSLQLERLNTALLLQDYKLKLQQEKDLNRISKLLNVMIINNYKAQNKKSKQLDEIISLLKDNLKNK